MSHLIFESQVKALMRQGVPRDYAILSASSKLEDKTLFYETLQRMKEENDVIQEQLTLAGFQPVSNCSPSGEELELSGFCPHDGGRFSSSPNKERRIKLSTYKEEENVPTNNEIQDIQHNEQELNEIKRDDELQH